MCSEKYLKMNKMCIGWLGLSVAALVASVVLALSCSPARKARTLFEWWQTSASLAGPPPDLTLWSRILRFQGSLKGKRESR